MRKFILCLIVLSAAVSAVSQTTTPEPCPAGIVCITPEAARKALQDSDTVKAQNVELAAKDTAIADLKAELANLRIELAKTSGEKSQMEADRVRWTAVIDVLLKSTRPKKIGLINLF